MMDTATTTMAWEEGSTSMAAPPAKKKHGGAHEYMRGWSPEEDTLLEELYTINGPNWKKNAAAMGETNPRTPAMCRNRFLRITNSRKEVQNGIANNKRAKFNKCGRCGQVKKGHICTLSMQTAEPALEEQARLKENIRSGIVDLSQSGQLVNDARFSRCPPCPPPRVEAASPDADSLLSRDLSPVPTLPTTAGGGGLNLMSVDSLLGPMSPTSEPSPLNTSTPIAPAVVARESSAATFSVAPRLPWTQDFIQMPAVARPPSVGAHAAPGYTAPIVSEI